MTFIPPGVLNQARALVTSSLPDLCDVQRKSGAMVNGAPSKAGATYATVHTGIPCRLRDYGVGHRFDEVLVAEQFSEVTLFVLLVQVGVDIRTDDQILINGKAMLALGTDAVTSWSAGMHVLLREVGA